MGPPPPLPSPLSAQTDTRAPCNPPPHHHAPGFLLTVWLADVGARALVNARARWRVESPTTTAWSAETPMSLTATALNAPTNLITLQWANTVGHTAVRVGRCLGVCAFRRVCLRRCSRQPCPPHVLPFPTPPTVSVQYTRYSFSVSAVGVIGSATLQGVQRSLVQCSARGFCNQFSGSCDCNDGYGV
jgi:hypothetical protein